VKQTQATWRQIPGRLFLSPGCDFRRKQMAINLKVPSVNQLITLAIAMAVLFFLLGFMPESIKKFFRV